jgi:hypothetical protein
MRLGTVSHEGVTYPYVLTDGAICLLGDFAGHDVGPLIGLHLKMSARMTMAQGYPAPSSRPSAAF